MPKVCDFFPFQDQIFASSTHLGAVPCCGSFVCPVSRYPSEGIIPYVVVDMLYLWEELSLVSSYAVIWIFLLQILILLILLIFCTLSLICIIALLLLVLGLLDFSFESSSSCKVNDLRFFLKK